MARESCRWQGWHPIAQISMDSGIRAARLLLISGNHGVISRQCATSGVGKDGGRLGGGVEVDIALYIRGECAYFGRPAYCDPLEASPHSQGGEKVCGEVAETRPLYFHMRGNGARVHAGARPRLHRKKPGSAVDIRACVVLGSG